MLSNIVLTATTQTVIFSETLGSLFRQGDAKATGLEVTDQLDIDGKLIAKPGDCRRGQIV